VNQFGRPETQVRLKQSEGDDCKHAGLKDGQAGMGGAASCHENLL
jgi:hypothetical protein